MFSILPVDRMTEGLLASWGLGLPITIPPTCGRPDMVPGQVILVGGTVATPLGAKMAMVGARIVPAGTSSRPVGAPSMLSGVGARPQGGTADVGQPRPPDGTGDDPDGDGLLAGGQC